MARSPLFGGASWTVRAPSHEGWVVAGGGDELPVALPTLFAVRGAELAGSSGEIRIYGTEEARAPDADAWRAAPWRVMLLQIAWIFPILW